MLKKSAALRLWCLFLSCCCAFSTLSPAQVVANKQQTLSQARRSYYNLRSEGLSAFECSITPNWELLLKDKRARDPKGADAAIRILNQLHFTVGLAPDNSVKLTHNELSGQSDEMMAALKQIYGSVELMTSGFFDRWKLFMLNSPFPEVSSDYRLEVKGSQYVLTYREDTADVSTTMGRDFAISNMKIITPEFDRVIQPSFITISKAFLLSAYQESYPSQKPEETTQLKVRIDYQPVAGLQMLHTLNLSGRYLGGAIAVELTFYDCQVTKKQ